MTPDVVTGHPRQGLYGDTCLPDVVSGHPRQGLYGVTCLPDVVSGHPRQGLYGDTCLPDVVSGHPRQGLYGGGVREREQRPQGSHSAQVADLGRSVRLQQTSSQLFTNIWLFSNYWQVFNGILIQVPQVTL